MAPVDDFPELAFLREWLDRGYAGEMAWMARTADRRRDVRRVLPRRGASSSPARSTTPTGPYSVDLPAGAARISRYAWGDDYHDVLKPRLDALVAWMREVSRASPSTR